MRKVRIPAEWDDNHLLMFEEFCHLVGLPQPAVLEWRRRGFGPRWTQFQGTGRLYITAEEARRFMRTATFGAAGGDRHE